MVQDALDGKIDLIVTKSVSRFARNTVDSLTTVRKLKEKGVDSPLENVTESISKAPDGENSESNNENTNIDSESTVLIAYFSWSGNTKQLAEMIQEQTGGELFEIEPVRRSTVSVGRPGGLITEITWKGNMRVGLSDEKRKTSVPFFPCRYVRWNTHFTSL